MTTFRVCVLSPEWFIIHFELETHSDLIAAELSVHSRYPKEEYEVTIEETDVISDWDD